MSDESRKNEIERKVVATIAAVAGRDPGAIERRQHLMADLGIDSPKALQLLMDLEDSLAIEIPDDAAASFERVGDLVDFVVARAGESAAG